MHPTHMDILTVPINFTFSELQGYCKRNENYDICVMNFIDVSICQLCLIYVLGKEEAEVELAMTVRGPSCHDFLDLKCNDYGMDG